VIARLDVRTVVGWRSNQDDKIDATITARRTRPTIRMMRPHMAHNPRIGRSPRK